MNRYFNIENTVIIEQAETAGACAGFLLGAVAGAKIGSSLWWTGPVTVASSILVGGTVGAVGGSNLGKVIVSQLKVYSH